MTTHRVTFLPDKKEVEVAGGSTLLEAAGQAGVHVQSICGGQGVCGQCRLQVVRGRARADKDSLGFFSSDEISQGYVLACQTPVTEDLEVVVPLQSRLDAEKIMTDSLPITYGEPGGVTLCRLDRDPAALFDPLVAKLYLELPAPTNEDNIADIDRVTRALAKRLTYASFEISLGCLQGLAGKLRANDWKVTATVARHDGLGRIIRIEPGDTSERNYGVAIDIGTTTVVTQLIHLTNGEVIGVKGNHNTQSRYGEDVISRMVFACGRGSLDPLHEAVIANINDLIKRLADEKGIDVNDITCIVAGGNTVMSHFLLGLEPCSIRLEPYVPTANVYPQVTAGEIGIGINPKGIVETIPSVASYIGGDTVAGVLAAGLADHPEVACLIDVGTNAEIAIGNNEWLVCASASAGPAFEGGGTKNGMRAATGAIEKVELHHGDVRYRTIGGGRPRGICGSGFIEAIYELAKHKIIGQDGKFNAIPGDRRLVSEDGIPQYILAFPEETETGAAVAISQVDIAHLIRSKGAVYAALKSLVDYVGLKFTDLHTIYLSGGFGSSLDIPKAIGIGLVPDVDPDKIRFLGNSCVMGSRMALLSGPAFESALSIARKMTNIELSKYPAFMNEFIAALFLPHTEQELFPSVHF
jgi:uncharacterized 2Fe-2S/4Fe-4S cluster protein (DUF4445 family)